MRQFTGSLNEKIRKQIVSEYNENNINILLISSAGSEVLDLKATNDIIILEPHWNIEKINQVIGRSIRFKSHMSLPEEERVVNVFKLILRKPEIIENENKDEYILSVDELLYRISSEKEEQFKKLKNILKQQSIENMDDNSV